jgi:hypothetical protein
VVERLREMLLASSRIFADETVVPVLDPGRGRTKKGYFWAIARDDRPWGGSTPPAVVYSYKPGRGYIHADALLGGYRGILQCDGYAAYKKFAGPACDEQRVTLVFCWSHVRRGFYDLAKPGTSPIATEALKRIAALYEIEARVRGDTPDARRAMRQVESRPLVEDLRRWFEAQLAKLPARSTTADAINYALNHWDGLARFLDDGRIDLGRVEVWRGRCRPNISVAAPFVWRCLTGSTLASSPHPARQTGHADFPHPAFSRPVRPSLSAGRRVAVERCRGRVSRRDTRLGSGGTQRLVVPSGASTSGGPVVPCMPERAHRFL